MCSWSADDCRANRWGESGSNAMPPHEGVTVSNRLGGEVR